MDWAKNLIVLAAGVLVLTGCDAPPGSKAANTGTPANEATADSGDDTVTMAEFQKLKNGMSYAEAVKIIGFAGTEMSSGDIGGIRSGMYSWTNPNGMSNMNAMFQNDKLTMKAQFGLK